MQHRRGPQLRVGGGAGSLYSAWYACRTVDALSFLSEKASEVVCRWHTRMYRHLPEAWRVSYRLMEQHPSSQDEHSLLVRILSLGTEKLYAQVVKEGYDCLICPHVFSALMVTQLRETHPELNFVSSYISTDYTCTPFVKNCRMDWYFAPSPSAAGECVQAGIPAGRVAVIPGVPVRREFYQRMEKTAARRLLGLPETGRMVLAMCGSMGCGHLDDIAEHLAQRLPAGDMLGVVCGTYTHLQKKLEGAFAGMSNVFVWGFRSDISLLMDCADIFLTKAGGASTSEAAVKGLPMVLVDAVSACETPNLRYFCSTGGAVTADSHEELTELCLRLLKDGAALDKMGAALLQKQNAAEKIWSILAGEEDARQ